MLGVREQHVYGRERLQDIETACRTRGDQVGLGIDFRQSNSEGELVTWIQEARDSCAGIIINAGALTHSSIAILDALLAVEMPIIEVHISNIFRREPFRHHSYVSQAAVGLICGLGGYGYVLAVDAMAGLLTKQNYS